MNPTIKSILSVIVLAMFGLALSCDASARDDYRTDLQIRACVAAIGSQADYRGAERVVHQVTRLRQRNYAELEIKVDTAVYGADDVREYAASCVTDTRGDLVKLRVNPIAE